MKMKSILLLAVALGCGLVAMMGVQQVLSGNKKETDGVSRVLFATSEINPGSRLNETNTVFKEWPAGAIPPGAVTSAEEIKERALMARAIPGEVILKAKLGEEGIRSASNEIPEGMRLATVSVNLTKIHSGLIMPGDRVDLVLTHKVTTPGRPPVTETLIVLSNVEVFATGSRRSSDYSESDGTEISAKNISLLVTPEQYQLCMLAESQGQLTLALRNSNDTTISSAAPIDETAFLKRLQIGGGEENPEEMEEVEETLEPIGLEEETMESLEVVEIEEEEVIPETPKWTIRIYEGDQVREEEVELPVDEQNMDSQGQTIDTEQLKSTAVPAEKPKTEKDLKTWIKTFLTGA